jgi:hypothetical protein
LFFPLFQEFGRFSGASYRNIDLIGGQSNAINGRVVRIRCLKTGKNWQIIWALWLVYNQKKNRDTRDKGG